MKKYTSLSLSRYLEEVCSKKPVPGGGSVSAYVASLGIGLAEMVARIGMKKVKPGFRVSLRRTLRLLEKARKDALQVVDLDPKIYQTLLKTYREGRSLTDPARKNRLLDEALENSFRLQADLAFLITLGKKGAQSLEGMIPGSIQNDLKVSLALLQAAFHGAYETARINAVYLKNSQKKNRAERALEELKKRFGA